MDKKNSDDWYVIKFGDIANHISKRVEPSETDLSIYVGLEHIDSDSLKIERHGVPSDVEGQKLIAKKGQIIFGKRRAYQRKVAIADWDCICSAHAMVLEPNLKNVLPDFLAFFMQSDIFMNRAIAISEGSLSPTIKWKTLAEQEFLFPNLKQQSRLLTIIKSLEATILSAKKFSQSALNLYQRMIDHYTTFDRLKMLPDKWERVRLKKITSINKKLISSASNRDLIINYIDISSVNFPGIIKNVQKIPFKDAPSRARRILSKNDVAISTVRPNHKATFHIKKSC